MHFPTDEELQELVADAFRAARDAPTPMQIGWGAAFTPPLPDPWPNPTRLTVFAYAWALALIARDGELILSVADGQLVTPPFAAVHLTKSEPPLVTHLASSFATHEVQGVGPASQEEIDLWQRSQEVYAQLAELPLTLSELARAYYCQWARVSGVIRRYLPAAQQRFLAELAT